MPALPEYLKDLEYLLTEFPGDAVKETIAHREEATPHLLKGLEWAADNVDAIAEADDQYFLHVYAMYLLAQFREPRAFPAIVKLFRHPHHESITGDIDVLGLDRMLAATCDGRISALHSLAEDAKLEIFVRSAAIAALGVLMHNGELPRADVSAYIGELLGGKLVREQNFVWDSAIQICADFAMKEHREAIRSAYGDGLTDLQYASLERVEAELDFEPGTSPNVDWEEYSLIDDTAAELECWECFTNSEENWRDYAPENPALPIQRETPKVGRNDQCPCGSGEKYKKCCGRDGVAQSSASTRETPELTEDQKYRRAAMMQALDEQLESPDTPEVGQHLQRLIEEGFSEEDARELVATVLSFYIYHTMKGDTYTYADYVAELERLPDLRWDNEAE